MPKKQLGFLINSERCVGCHGCEMACKNEYQIDVKPRWRRVYLLEEKEYSAPERNHMSIACNHCANPACQKVCPVDAYSKREDGIVMQDQEKCIGCKSCIKACPYNAPQFNVNLNKVEKCELCYERLAAGKKPACVDNCVVGALDLIELSNFHKSKTKRSLPGFPNPNLTNPSVRFISPNIGRQIRSDSK